jgi:2,4-dienoyl-CoA reductase-like NADH-dependent reductase (Old Yellow Enzyme family)
MQIIKREKKMLQLKNQFIFAPIKTGYSDKSGVITERHLAFYKRRAPYLGAVIPEPFYLDKGLRELPTQLGIDHDDKIGGLKKLVDSIHRSGTKSIAHLNHPGRMANPKIAGNYFISSTHRPCENEGAAPDKMNREDMKKVMDQFVKGAERAEKAGFDSIELQFGHGYLLAQYLSPFVNDRADEFGGSFKNRIKFPLEILQAVMDSVSLPILVRISGDEMIPDGIKLSEMIEFSKILGKKGVTSVPDIPGLDKFYWADILLEENLPENKKVMIIGGGLIGVDIATALIPRNNKVIIVKRTTDFGEDMEMIAKTLSLRMMTEKGTIFSDFTHIKRVEGKTIYAERGGGETRFDDVDIIVVSTSMASYKPLEKELIGEVPVYVIGDARQVGNAQDAIRDGYEIAKEV